MTQVNGPINVVRLEGEIFNINKMYGIGTPTDLEYFINNYKL